ncbi:MAG TPA: bifunctional UDP-2,4-diacetamido-2,4,6-trideoxy-beta-L-altropyranose hydrolase/GNAT family N-acetyltransferase [Candidatus Omnitrophota bacterium]|nr:bifunctional UDP-2,4-diacetamido-2,4,6-trideoxy-beta-L-altropyranose hydrolase/GNAT family N-acetyltransferase [Candidatus Omnitrophota bacterium]
MDIRILTEGGKKQGFGHLSRCLSLFQGFATFKPKMNVRFLVRADAYGRKYMREAGCPYESIDWLKRSRSVLKNLKKDTIVFVDSYQAPLAFYRQLYASDRKPFVVVFDDYDRLAYDAHAVINATISDKRDVGYRNRKGLQYLIGQRYAMLRNGFNLKKKKNIRKDLAHILISLGGTRNRDLMDRIIRVVRECGLQSHVIGPVHAGRSTDIRAYPFLNAKDLRRLMAKVDLCISAGGQTLNELAGMGVPTIALCLADNQLPNIKKYERLGFVAYIGRSNHPRLMDELKETLLAYKSEAIRRERSFKGQSLVDGLGARRIIQDVLFHYYKGRFQLRKARYEDAKRIFQISNDPLARANSSNTRKIRWNEHLKWFDGKLKDKNCMFYVLNGQEDVQGQIRFQVDPARKDAVISISLDPSIRGLSLSPSVISRSVDRLLRQRSDIRSVTAIIKEKNAASIRAFEKARFEFRKNLTVKNVRSKALVYLKDK